MTKRKHKKLTEIVEKTHSYFIKRFNREFNGDLSKVENRSRWETQLSKVRCLRGLLNAKEVDIDQNTIEEVQDIAEKCNIITKLERI